MSRRPLLGGLVALVLAGAGCSVPTERQAQVRDDDAVPFGLLEPDTPPLLPPNGPSATERTSVNSWIESTSSSRRCESK